MKAWGIPVTLVQTLQLTELVARKAPARRSRYAVRWLQRYLESHAGVTVEQAAVAASALAALGGPAHEAAYASLMVMAEQGQ